MLSIAVNLFINQVFQSSNNLFEIMLAFSFILITVHCNVTLFEFFSIAFLKNGTTLSNHTLFGFLFNFDKFLTFSGAYPAFIANLSNRNHTPLLYFAINRILARTAL